MIIEADGTNSLTLDELEEGSETVAKIEDHVPEVKSTPLVEETKPEEEEKIEVMFLEELGF